MTFRSYQIRWTSILGALTVAVVLSGCGGGGGGAMMATDTTRSDSSTNPPSERSTNAFGFGIPGSTGDVTGISNAVVNAAGNQPRAGSVTQSSDGQEGVTTNVVKVTVSGNPATGLRYDVNYNSEIAS